MIDIKDINVLEIPGSWHAKTIRDFCGVKTTSFSFSDIDRISGAKGVNTLKVLALKVSDMNLLGNETVLKSSTIEFYIEETHSIVKKLIPPGSIIFPKRGAAIAT